MQDPKMFWVKNILKRKHNWLTSIWEDVNVSNTQVLIGLLKRYSVLNALEILSESNVIEMSRI